MSEDYQMFSEPSTLDQMREYILMQLGKPNICVEIPNQVLDMIIMDSVSWFWRYAADIGTHSDYLCLKVTTGRTKYKVPNLQAVGEVSPIQSNDGINTLFAPMHNLLYRDWVIFGQYPGGPNDGAQGLSLTSYDITMSYLKDIDSHFGTRYLTKYDTEREVLSIYPEPKFDHVLLIKVFIRQAPKFIFKNPLFRRYVVAKSRQWWANMFGKINMTLPGGGTVNHDIMYSRATDEINMIEEQIRLESEPPVFLIG